MPDGSGPALALIIALVVAVIMILTTFAVVTARRRSSTAPPPLDEAAPPLPPPDDAPEAATAPDAAVDVAPAPPAPPTEEEAVLVEEPPAPVEPVVQPEPEPEPEPQPEPEPEPEIEAPAPPKRRVRSIGAGLKRLFGGGTLGEEEWEDIEEVLLLADVGIAATTTIVENLRARGSISDGRAALREELLTILGGDDRSLNRKPDGMSVWLVTGVNGVGKTTTIGKLAAQLRDEGASTVLAAADTFRAAADEQLLQWAERAGAELVKHQAGADPAAVVFDGVKVAREKGASVLIVDTAGRLQNKKTLMDELGKIGRVLEREAGAPDETLLVLDATTGQNGLVQARAFKEAVGITGIALTKLDGTAKGGIVVAIQAELGIPVKLVGLGEGIDDLAAFDPSSFVDDLLSD